MPTKKMQNQIFQSFVKFMHGKKTKKTNKSGTFMYTIRNICFNS